MPIDSVLTAYFEIFTKEYFLILFGIGICCIYSYVIYTSIK